MSDLTTLKALLADKGYRAAYEDLPTPASVACETLTVVIGNWHLEATQMRGEDTACLYTFPAVNGRAVTTDPDSPKAVYVDLTPTALTRKLLRLADQDRPAA